MREGSVVHIKDSYFELANDSTLMQNYEANGYRPHFLCMRDPHEANIIWAVPISSKTAKYQVLRERKILRFGRCDTIVIAPFCGKIAAFLVQNAFPITEEYIDHPHIVDGVPVVLGDTLCNELSSKLKRCLSIHKRTGGTLFADVDSILLRLKKHDE